MGGWPSPTTSSGARARPSWRRSAWGGPTSASPTRWPGARRVARPRWRATCGWAAVARAPCPTWRRRPPRPAGSGRSTRRPASWPRASRSRRRRTPRPSCGWASPTSTLARRPRGARRRLRARPGAARGGRGPRGARRRLGGARPLAAHLHLLPARVARGLPHRARTPRRRRRRPGGRGAGAGRLGLGRVGRRRPRARRGRHRGARGAARRRSRSGARPPSWPSIAPWR